MGINIEGKAAFTRWFDLQAGITLQQSRYKEPEQWSEDPEVAPTRKMFRTPNTYGYLTAELTPVRNLQAAITGTYTGKMLVQHMAGSGTPVDRAVTTPRFFDLNLKVSYDVILYKEIALQLHAGIQNIFNAYQKDFDRGPTAIRVTSMARRYPAAGSSVRRSASDGLPEAPAAPCFAGQGISLSLIRIDGIRNFLKISLSESHDIFRV